MTQTGDRVLSEKTKLLLTLSNFVGLIFALVAGVVFVVTWKADIEYRLASTENNVVTNEAEIQVIKVMQDSTQLQLVGIQTDLKWIIADMKKTNANK